MNTQLKMKICALAAEARRIRTDEKKWPGDSSVRSALRKRRTVTVRREARCSQLAYGLLRGRRYAQLETAGSRPVDWPRVAGLVTEYAERDNVSATQQVKEWAAPEGTASDHNERAVR